MKILQFCKKFPYPAKDGEAIAILNLTKAYHQLGHETTVLAIETPKHPYNEKGLNEETAKIADFNSVYVNTNISAIDAFFNLFTDKSYNIERFVNRAVKDKLKFILSRNTFDVIQLEGLFLTPYVETIRKHSNAKIVMRSHNVEFEIWKRLAENTAFFPKKKYIELLAQRMERFEVNHLNDYDAMIPITSRDGDFFKLSGCKIPMKTAPAGMDFSNPVFGEAKSPLVKNGFDHQHIFFLGALDWLPNQEGVIWFLENVWSKVTAQFPNAVFKVAGRHIPDWFYKYKSEQVQIIGEVECAPTFMQQNAVMIVPILSGSGMRIKIIEAMALGKTVISTSVGAEGIAYNNEENIFVADKPEVFAKYIIDCLTDYQNAMKVGHNGMKLAKKKFDSVEIAKNLVNFYEEVL